MPSGISLIVIELLLLVDVTVFPYFTAPMFELLLSAKETLTFVLVNALEIKYDEKVKGIGTSFTLSSPTSVFTVDVFSLISLLFHIFFPSTFSIGLG